jgi:hypothetical protein
MPFVEVLPSLGIAEVYGHLQNSPVSSRSPFLTSCSDISQYLLQVILAADFISQETSNFWIACQIYEAFKPAIAKAQLSVILTCS